MIFLKIEKLHFLRVLKKLGLILTLPLVVTIGFASDSVTNKILGGDFYPLYPTPNYGTGAQRELVQRGEYLVRAGDCISCHTNVPGGGKPFSGGLALNTPFGVFYSPNITPDKKTGIGNWTDQDFIRALHQGINPKGKYYFPVFPYTSFTQISRADLLAIKAYLFSLPPINQANKKPGAPWPFSWRFAQFGWRQMFFHEGYYQYNPTQSAQWNRGAYLVQGLGHCGECHTPRNLLGAMKNKYYLTGAFVDNYWAPNITNLTFGAYTIPEVVSVFDKAELVNATGPVRGPMAEVDHNSLMSLTQTDLDAIALYLKSLKSKEPLVPNVVRGEPSLIAGKKIYKRVCAICHDKGVAGAPMIYDTANWANRLQQGINVLYLHVIQGYNNMPPMGACVTCSEQDIKNAVNYILANSQNPAVLRNIAGQKAPQPNTSIAVGKVIYDTKCAVCHQKGLLEAPILGDQKVWNPLLAKGIDVLIMNTITGINNMPPNGACKTCSTPEIIAAVKYMAQQANPNANYSEW